MLLPETCDLSNKGISSLDGLESAGRVRFLNLAHNNISNILPLLSMNSLEAVSLANNRINFKNNHFNERVSRALKSLRVFVYEAADTQDLSNTDDLEVFFNPTEESDFLVVRVQNDTDYTLKARKASGGWGKLVERFSTDRSVELFFTSHHNAYRLEPLASPQLLEDLTDTYRDHGIRYQAYVDHLVDATEPDNEQGLEYVVNDVLLSLIYNYITGRGISSFSIAYDYSGNNWEGLWFSDAVDWYHDRGGHLYVLLYNYNPRIRPLRATKENAEEAFQMGKELRNQACLLMGNQFLAPYILSDLDGTFDKFVIYARDRLIYQNKAVPSDEEVYLEIIRLAQPSHNISEGLISYLDSVLEFIRTQSFGYLISPETDYFPLLKKKLIRLGRH